MIAQYNLLGREGLSERFGLPVVLAFFSNRILRGGPKILFNLAACLVVLILITKMMPSRMTDIALKPAYDTIWRGGSSSEKEQEAGAGEEELGGGLRIVVFGESDIGTPGPADGGEDGMLLSWTEMLCADLGCSKHLSFVPRADPQRSAMTSNTFYAAAVEQVLNETADSTLPALDYTFVPDLFPVKWNVPDLAAQVTEFLTMEKPDQKPPTETIWVFSVGPWDVWSLASLPITVSKSITDMITADIFIHVERLYAASRDENSIAYSNYFDEATTAASDNDTSVMDRAEYPSEKATIEPFRVIIPKVFDPSVLPGWWDSRPPTASVHSKAEQMKHASELTEHWNNNLHNGLAEWILTGTLDSEKSDDKDGENKDGNAIKPSRKRPQRKRPVFQKDRKESEAESEKEEQTTTSSAVPSEASEIATETSAVPRYALRDGLAYDMPDYVLAVMADRQLRNSDLKDSNGLGDGSAEDSFLEVWTPCIQPANPVPFNRVDPSDLTIDIKYEEPEEKPEEKEPERKEESKEKVSDDKKDEKTSDDKKDETEKEDEKSSDEKKDEEKAETKTDPSATKKQRRATIPAKAEESSTPELSEVNATDVSQRICPEPDDHLFHTSFTLSQRAISIIAKEIADMVRFNETVRMQWAKQDEKLAEGNKHH